MLKQRVPFSVPRSFNWRWLAALVGMLGLVVLSLWGLWELFRGGRHLNHLLTIFVAVLALTMALLLAGYVINRTDLAETRMAHLRLQKALLAGNSVGWDLNVKTGQNFWFGDLKTMFGIPSEIMTVNVGDFYRYVHSEDRWRVSQAVSDARDKRMPYATEFRVVRQDGSIGWVSATGEFQYTKRGEPMRMLGIAVDITERRKFHEALIKSEEKFSKAFRGSPIALALTSVRDHRFLDVNDTFEKITGWRRDEVIGQTPFDINIWVNPAEREEAAREILAKGSIRDREFQYRCKDGSQGLGLGAAELIEIDGELCVLAATLDITDRKRAEDALRRKEAELAEAQGLARVGSWEWDIEIGVIQWSEELYRIYGLDSKKPAPTLEELPKLYTAETWSRLERAIETRSFPDMEMELIRPDGAKRWVRMRFDVTRDSAGTVTRLRGISQDITDEKQIRDQLKQNEARMKAIVDSAMDAIIAVDEAQRIVLFNVAAEKMFQYTAAEAIGSAIDRFIPPPFRAIHKEHIARFGQTGITNRQLGTSPTLFGLRSTGEAFPMEASISQTVDEMGTKVFTVIIRDITERLRSEHTVRESQEQFRRVVENIGDAVIVDDIEGRVIFANERFLQLFGITREQLPHRRLEDYVAPEYREELRDRHNRRVRGESAPARSEYEGIRFDGSRLWLEVNSVPVYGSDGKITGTQSAIRDITERKHAEHVLQESEDKFRRVVEHIADALAVDDVNGRIVFANDQFLNLFGFQRAAIGKITLEDYVAPEYRTASRDRHERRMRGQEEDPTFEYEGIRRNGTRLWVEAHVVGIRDNRGNLVGSQKILRNATERKLAEEALRESEERFRFVANAAPVMIWMSDVNNLCTYVNKPWLDFTGRTMQAELGAGWADRIHPEDLDRCLKAVADAVERRGPLQMQYRVKRHDGQFRWIYDIGVPRFNPDGSFAGFIGSCIDVTERKQAEEALATVGRRLIEAHEEERTWIGRELHDDINQRLALLAVELDRWSQSVGKNSETQQRIHHAGQRVAEIAKDVQSLSHRLHSSKLEYLGLAKAVDSFCRELSAQNRIEINVTHEGVPRTLPKEISLCLFRVVQEALQNAVKHSGVRHFTVDLNGTTDAIELTVSDNGKGFEEQEAFTRAGLGLISMRERLQLVHGELLVKSKPGAGTTIYARVPLNRDELRAIAG